MSACMSVCLFLSLLYVCLPVCEGEGGVGVRCFVFVCLIVHLSVCVCLRVYVSMCMCLLCVRI